MSDEVTEHQIQGFCEGIMIKGDWQEFHINIGKQYPVKLASKHDDVKAAAAAAGKEQAIWTYGEKNGNPNPHRPGEFFKNRYLNKVEVGGTLSPQASAAQAAGGSSSASSGSSGGRPEAERISIERQTIVKAVLASSLPFPGEDDLFTFLDKMDDWMARQRPSASAPSAQAAPVEPAAPSPVEPDPDDIPF